MDLWRKIKRVNAVPISRVAPFVFVAKSAIRWKASRKRPNVMIVDLYYKKKTIIFYNKYIKDNLSTYFMNCKQIKSKLLIWYLQN
jgi:hypothetical protein